jgi:hypothetical protein
MVCCNDWPVGYSDFHNLLRFTSKKMPNNILKNVCKNFFQLVKPFLANLHSTSSNIQWARKVYAAAAEK